MICNNTIKNEKLNQQSIKESQVHFQLLLLSSSNFNSAFKFLTFTIPPFYSLNNLNSTFELLMSFFFLSLPILLESYVLSVSRSFQIHSTY